MNALFAPVADAGGLVLRSADTATTPAPAAEPAQRAALTPADRLDGATSVLLAAPSVNPAETHACTSLLAGDRPSDTHAVGVEFTRSPASRIRHWVERADHLPASLTLLTVTTPSLARTQAEPGRSSVPSWVDVEPVTTPKNLTRFGIDVTEPLAGRAAAGGRTAFCFHSLSAFLHYADLDAAFQFLNVLLGHLAESGADAHFHIDPDAHDERTMSRLKPLFDGLLEVDAEGIWTVSTR